MMDKEYFWLFTQANAEELYKLLLDVIEGRKKIVGTSCDDDCVSITTEEA